MSDPKRLLSTPQLCAALETAVRERFSEFLVAESVPSTNSALLEVEDAKGAYFLAAHEQTAGRGRRERHWLSNATDLTFSLSRNLDVDARQLGAVSIVAGVAIVTALRGRGHEVFLKWPNDVVTRDGRKVGGILVEARTVRTDRQYVVIGVGLNAGEDAARDVAVGQATGALEVADANADVAAVLNALMHALDTFERHGLQATLDAWPDVDALAGAVIDVIEHGKTWIAQANGLDDAGRLRAVTADGAEIALTSAEVSVRWR